MIRLKGLGKRFKIYRNPWWRLLEWLTLGVARGHEDFWALKDISLTIERGECVGIIGENGAGKSTLLRVLSRVLNPTQGTCQTGGRIVSLLELGTGLNSDLSGRENIRLAATLLGFAEVVERHMEDIEAFSELGDFLDRPVRTYSSGMLVRLTFSIYAFAEPEIYIVDEALSVGDVRFQRKCFEFLRALQRKGCTILMVSHDLQAIRALCSRAILMKQGRVLYDGDCEHAINAYYWSLNLADLSEGEVMPEVGAQVPASDVLSRMTDTLRRLLTVEGIRRYGEKSIELVGFGVGGPSGPSQTVFRTGAVCTIDLAVRAREELKDYQVGIEFINRLNIPVYGTTSFNLGTAVPMLRAGEVRLFRFTVHLDLFEGTYSLCIGLTNQNLLAPDRVFDRLDGLVTVEVVRADPLAFHGIAKLRTSLEILDVRDDVAEP